MKNTQNLAVVCQRELFAPVAHRQKLTSCKDYTFPSLPRRITDFVQRTHSQIKFSRDAGRRNDH